MTVNDWFGAHPVVSTFSPHLESQQPGSRQGFPKETTTLMRPKNVSNARLKNFPENYNMIMTMGNLHILHIFQWEINIFKTVDFPLSC